MGERSRPCADRLLDEAEGAHRYAFASSRTEAVALRRRRDAGRVVEPAKGYFVRSTVYEGLSKRARTMHLIRAVAHKHPTWIFASFSAALVHGLQVSQRHMDMVHIVVGSHEHKRKPGGFIACHLMEGVEPTVVEGIRVTSLSQTLLDCTCSTSFRYGLALVDSAVHWDLTTVSELKAYFDGYGRRKRGIATARKVLQWVDGKSENGGESIARAVMIELGFTVPELQREVADPMEPQKMKRVDYYWLLPDGTEVMAELDGKRKYKGANGGTEDVETAIQRFSDERLRESHLNLTRALVVRFSFAQVTDEDYMRRLLTCAGIPLREAS